MRLANKLKKDKCIIRPILLLCAGVISLGCVAEIKAENHPTVDIYKTNQVSINIVKERFKNEFQNISDAISSKDSLSSEINAKLVGDSISRFVVGMKKMGDFAYVGISPIMYRNDKIIHISIDVVDKTDEKRLHYFSKKPEQDIHDPDNLISKWKEYESISASIIFKEKKFPTYQSCPAYHCMFGFEHSALKKYKSIFATFVPKDKATLISILKNDKDENKRSAAAYLLAHIRDRNELINTLVPSVFDPSEKVRNSVMRVLGFTLMKGEIPSNFPIDSIIQALDFPMTTDRNKALLIIHDLSKKPIYARYIAKKSGKTLIDILKLPQPNVHGLAYDILKQISGKKYGERDYASWQNWLSESQR